MKVYRSNKAKMGIHRTYDMLLKEWGTQYTERDIATTYGDTHVIECGDADCPPLVLFHGVGDDSALMWLFNAKALSGRFKLYAADTLGGPGKSVPNTMYNKDYSDTLWIDELLTALGLEKASLMGVSHGGYLVQLYTLHNPERVDKAICLAAALPIGESGNPMKAMMKIFLPEALFPTKKNVRKLLTKMSGANSSVFTENALIMEHYTWLLKGFSPMSMRFHNIRPFTDGEVSFLRDTVHYSESTLNLVESYFSQRSVCVRLLAHR